MGKKLKIKPMDTSHLNYDSIHTIGISLQKKRDAKIIARIMQEENRSAFLRKAVTYYIDHEDEILYPELMHQVKLTTQPSDPSSSSDSPISQ